MLLASSGVYAIVDSIMENYERDGERQQNQWSAHYRDSAVDHKLENGVSEPY